MNPNTKDRSQLPPTVCTLERPFVDERGVIQNLLHIPVGGVVLITSKAGSTRAQHWHREDWHFCYILSGAIEYFEREVGSLACPRRELLQQGHLFFTPSHVEHEMYFPRDTTFLTLANRHREPADYEKDLVRLDASLRAAWLKTNS